MSKKDITPDNLPDLPNELASDMHQPGGCLVKEKKSKEVEFDAGYRPTHCPQCSAPLKMVPTWYADDGKEMDHKLACPTCGLLKIKEVEEPVEKRFPQRDPKNPGKVRPSPWLQSIIQPMSRPGPAGGVITAAPSQEFAMDAAADALQGG
jgi:hypothetical protein